MNNDNNDLNLKEFVIKKGEASIDCIAFGNGSKPLVLIMGLSVRGIKGSGGTLSSVYRKLCDEYRIYVFDRINPLPYEVTLKDLADDIIYCMDKLCYEKVSIIGISQGGIIAQRLAIDNPERVAALVLVSTLSRSNKKVELAVNLWISMALDNAYEVLLRSCLEYMYSDEYVEAHKDWPANAFKIKKPMHPMRFVGLAKSCRKFDMCAELPKIKCPVFVIGGAADKLLTVDAIVETARILDCRCFLYTGLGHAFYEEAPDFVDRVLNFLENVPESCYE